MKIVFSNKNIVWWLFSIFHLVPIITYKHDELFIFSLAIIFLIWIFNLALFLIACNDGDVKFNFEIKILHNYFEQKRKRNVIKKQILELKSKAIASIEDDKKFEKIINQIIKLEENYRSV